MPGEVPCGYRAKQPIGLVGTLYCGAGKTDQFVVEQVRRRGVVGARHLADPQVNPVVARQCRKDVLPRPLRSAVSPGDAVFPHLVVDIAGDVMNRVDAGGCRQGVGSGVRGSRPPRPERLRACRGRASQARSLKA